jgi:hypothetical protein
MDLKTIPRRAAVRRGVVGLVRGFVQRSLFRPYLYLSGMIHLRRGRLAAAESCLCRAALISPRHFATRVQLGRIYFLMDEFFKAEQQFLKAQEIDPGRFRRDHLIEEDGAWPEFESEETGERGFYGDYEAQAALYAFDEHPQGAPPDPAGPETGGFRYGDFGSYDEWLRFRDLPPIDRAEIGGIDWDRFFTESGS